MDEDFDLKFDRKLSKFLRRARFVIRLACFLIVAYIGYTVAMSGRDYRENSMSPKIKYYLSGFGIEDEQIQEIAVDRNGKWDAQEWDIEVTFVDEPGLTYVFQERHPEYVLVSVTGRVTRRGLPCLSGKKHKIEMTGRLLVAAQLHLN